MMQTTTTNSILALLLLLITFTNARRLSLERIADYEPRTQVTDQNAMDLDVSIMKQLLAMEMEESFGYANRIYTQGGNSFSVCQLFLATPLLEHIAKGTEVIGTSIDGDVARGMVLENTEAGSLVLHVKYETTDIQALHLNCKVGGLAAFGSELLDGCFQATGTVQVQGNNNNNNNLAYTYDPLEDNRNARTLAGLSLNANVAFRDNAGVLYPDFKLFVDYYGVADYGNRYVMAAFEGTNTNFRLGNQDFSTLNNDDDDDSAAIREAIQGGAVYLNIWMQVIGQMEQALEYCKIAAVENSIFAWDQAVAFYVGSLEGSDGLGDGVLLYDLADKRCQNFNTCGSGEDDLSSSSSSSSNVNLDVVVRFQVGQLLLEMGDCEAAGALKNEILELVKIPLIQQLLRYSYILEHQDASNRNKVRAATGAAAVLPFLYACSGEDASIVHGLVQIDGSTTPTTTMSFATIKTALERNYECMGVVCSDVGGLYDESQNAYFAGAEPCEDDDGGEGPRIGYEIIIAITVVVVGGLMYIC